MTHLSGISVHKLITFGLHAFSLWSPKRRSVVHDSTMPWNETNIIFVNDFSGLTADEAFAVAKCTRVSGGISSSAEIMKRKQVFQKNEKKVFQKNSVL